MGTLWRDVRFGAQALVRSPGFSLVAVLTLALGIGANGAIFSIVSGTLLNSLPWKDPATVVGLYEHNLKLDLRDRFVSTAKYEDWREQLRSFTDLSAVYPWGFNLTDGGNLDFVDAAVMSPNNFPLLGIRPELGRGFVAADARPGAEPVVVLSQGLWERRYGADPEIIGKQLEIDGEPATVVGVLSAEQWFPWPWTQLMAPLRLQSADLSRTDHRLGVFGRLAPGVSLAEAQAELDVVTARLAGQYPETDAGWTAEVGLSRDRVVMGETRTAIWTLMGAVGFVLLIACANVANLLLARGAARQKELSIRAAIGADRLQITRQLLTESAVLALLALPLALLLTRWALDFFLSRVPDSITYVEQFFRFDAPVLSFLVGATFLTVFVFGLVPTLQAAKPDLVTNLKEGGDRGSSHGGGQRLRSGLVVVQIALALALLISCGLLIQSFGNTRSSDPGFRIDNLLTTSLDLPETRYAEKVHWRGFQRDAVMRLEQLPGVRSVGVVNNAPFGFSGWDQSFKVEGRAAASDEEVPRGLWSNASPAYFRTLGIRLLQGRSFDEGDTESSLPVVVINETLARRYFAGGSPLGERLVLEDDEAREIVGVVADIKHWGFADEPTPQIYEPFAQRPSRYMSLVLRTSADPLTVVAGLRREMRALDPLLPIFTVETMTSRAQRSLWQQSLFALLMGILGGLALLLASVGVYGVVSISTAQRTREFGIRSALGAEPRGIALLVLRESVRLAAYGIALGLVLTAVMVRAIAALLYEVTPWDPVTFVSLSVVLAAVAIVSSTVPAVRATRVDPIEALRAE